MKWGGVPRARAGIDVIPAFALPPRPWIPDQVRNDEGGWLIRLHEGIRSGVQARDARGIVSSTQVPEGKCDRADGDRDHGHGQQDQDMRDAEAVNQRFICFVVVEKRRESAGS